MRLVVDVKRKSGETKNDIDLLLEFGRDFKVHEWPWDRMPEVLYDPRSLELDSNKRSSMHAKVVVVDEEVALITSANFTTAAQTKNIEVGALVRQPVIAKQLVEHFEALHAHGWLKRLMVGAG